MSKNVVCALIEFCADTNTEEKFGFIPSRRQIECSILGGGYVNSWTTKDFVKYVRSKSKLMIQRDHAGIYQGLIPCLDATISLDEDIDSKLDLIHIDPWKAVKNIQEAIKHTVGLIRYCELLSKNNYYEIGTEEAIFQYQPKELDEFVFGVKKELGTIFDKVVFVVVQSGTNVKGLSNVGIFDTNRCKEMNDICRQFGKFSKEHNSDYLSNEELLKRIENGVDCLNIAPEMGSIESITFVDELIKNSLFSVLDDFKRLCIDSNKWVKWTEGKRLSDDDIVKICGHYQFSHPKFLSLKKQLDYDFDLVAKENIKKKLRELNCLIK